MVLRYSLGSYLFPGPSPGTRPDPTFPVLTRTLLRYSPGFHLSGTHPDPSLVLARIPSFQHSPRFQPFPVLARTLLRYSPGFHLSSTSSDSTFPGTRPNLSLVLARIPPFSGTRPDFHLFGTHPDFTLLRYLPGFLLFWYSPGSNLSGTHPDPSSVLARIPPFWHSPGFQPFSVLARSFFGTSPDSTFLALARILPFPVLARTFLWYLPGFHLSLVLVQISTFWHSPGFYLSSVLARISTFPVLARISTFLALAQILPFPGTHPNPSPILTQIPPFQYSPGFHLFGTRLATFLALARILPFPILAWIHPSPVLARIPLFVYSPGFLPFFDAHSDSTFPALAQISTFSALVRILPFLVLTRIQPFPVLARTLLRSLPGFHYLFRHHVRIPRLLRHRPQISLSFLALCPDHSSSQASYLVFFKSFN